MRRMAALCAVILAALLSTSPITSAAPPAPPPGAAADDPFTAARTQWWRDARFGMFIHFGAYSQLEGEYRRPDGSLCQDAEWIMRKCKVPVTEYERLAKAFNPARFNAKEIVGLAKAAGQRYLVITSKHHDGYAMWPTAVNKWNLREHSAFDQNRDILAELKAEADRQGIKFGLYYSIWDWHDPDAAQLATYEKYKARLRAQLAELVDRYDPAVLWFDGDWAADSPTLHWTRRDGAELEGYLRAKSPNLLINNRISYRPAGVKERRVVDGDFGTPEQTFPTGTVDAQLWESCMTIAAKWGFARWDTNWKNHTQLIRNLTDIAGRGGNYLLNVGPDRHGVVPTIAADRLRAMGNWLRTAGQGAAVFGAGEPGVVADPDWGAVSRTGDTLHAAVYQWPQPGKSLHLKAIAPFTVLGARVLSSPQPVRVTPSGDGYDITPSGKFTNDAASVIELRIRPQSPAPPGNGTGLRAEYFGNPDLAGPPELRRIDPEVNFAWRFAGDRFSVRWQGFLQPRFSETYTLRTVSDEAIRVWVDGKLVIDANSPHETRVDKTSLALTAGQRHAIRIEYREQTGEAFAKLLWSSPNQPQQIVPRSQLYPSTAGAL
ncbi:MULTISPECIES: alpha-L-fucosidase [unclassified Crossiella]|uniref:alpha-L-fucosidase n=1 Tax=unclassified Crossiella TaxID=2620835 RepID=UPI001FFEE629|nr:MULTISPECIES: alpha-L-fucosidase [unclassified Crossiella]MCK2240408.1 alpha-L-fucosidase [Crossiella sp. S99.2]MCK2253140.1 alpha-L-fucosidase [Crossiella sp. S99.1]